MSINNYATLQTAVENWLNRPDLATTYTPDLIRLGEIRIYRDLRIRCMETALSSAISSGVLAIPSSYKEMKFAYIESSPISKLQRKDAEWIYHNYRTRSADGTPKFFAREGENFIFGPYPDSDYTVKGVYYKSLPALSGSNTTNWFTDNAPDLLLYASLCEAAPFIKNDERIPIWEGRYNLAKDRIQQEDDREEFSGSPLAMTVR